MKALQILAPKQEVFWVEDVGLDTVTDGEPNETYTVGAAITPGKIPDFKQCDPQWKNHPYPGVGMNPQQCSSSNTICNNGCAVVSLASVLVYHGYNVTPIDAANYAASIGKPNSCSNMGAGALCTHLSKKYPKLGCTPIPSKNVAQVVQKLKENKPVIFSCHKCTGTTVNGKQKTYKAHYMVFTGVNSAGTEFTVSDVGNKGADRNIKSISISEFQAGKIVNMFVVEPK